MENDSFIEQMKETTKKSAVENEENEKKLIKNYGELIEAKRLFTDMDNKQIASRIDMPLPSLYRAYNLLRENNILTQSDTINPDFGSFLGISIGASICKVVIISMDFRSYEKKQIIEYLLSVCEGLIARIPKDQEIERIPKDQENEQEDNRSLIEVCRDNLENASDTKQNYVFFDTPSTLSVLKNCIDFIIEESLKEGFQFKIKGVGISTTGLVDHTRNEIVTASNLKYLEKQDVETLLYPELYKRLEERNIHVSLIQNTNASLLYEKTNLYQDVNLSKYRDLKNVASLYFGVGLGVGLCLNGRLYYGSNGFAGEIGHIPALEFEKELSDYAEICDSKVIGDERCTCGREKCYDHKIRKYVFRTAASEFKGYSTDKVISLLTPNTDEKKERFKLFGQYLGGIISYLINTLNLDLIVLSGKLYKMDYELLDYINMALDDYCITSSRKQCSIIKASSGTLSPAYGAAIYSYYDHYGLTPTWK